MLSMLTKIFQNIVDHPAEEKFRRLSWSSSRLQKSLLCYTGASEFLQTAGFVLLAGDVLELPLSANAALLEAHSSVRRRSILAKQKRSAVQTTAGKNCVSSLYKSAVEGGAHGAGQEELAKILLLPDGRESLHVVERILLNIRRYPDSERYRTVNLAKTAGQKVLPALPLLEVAGFERRPSPDGDDGLQLPRINRDDLERVWAMVWWATRPTPEALPQPSGVVSHMLGALLGVAIGDALGAPLGGKDPLTVTAQEVDKAMEMCGGGVWGVAPGQVTDNTELMLCLAASLAESPHDLTFPADNVALRYGKWGQTMPFRVERACGQVFCGSQQAHTMIERAAQFSPKTRGTGALLRCAPLAVLGARNRPDVAGSLARTDASLSHPTLEVGCASAAYVVTLAHLIASLGDRNVALEGLQNWVKEERRALGKGSVHGPLGWTCLPGKPEREESSVRDSKRSKEDTWVPPGAQLVAMDELIGWLNSGIVSREELPFGSDRGEATDVSVPLSLAFRHVKLGSSFETAMRAVLAGAADASTNAAAVGGLLGAAVGLSGIPERWVRAVLTCDTSMGRARSPEYHPSRLPALVEQICK